METIAVEAIDVVNGYRCSKCTQLNIRNEILARDLEEAKQRCVQMEKTIRWWSDCTGSWRDKWSKVRLERNKTRDECRGLKERVESLYRELMSSKRTASELFSEKERLIAQLRTPVEIEDTESTNGDDNQETDLKTKSNGSLSVTSIASDFNSCELEEKTASSRLLEATKIIETERACNAALHSQISALEAKLSACRTNLVDAEDSVQMQQNRADQAEASHEHTKVHANVAAQEAQNHRALLEAKIESLRRDLEAAQAENSLEWGRRERVETERLALERECKQLRMQLSEAEEQITTLRRRKATALTIDSDDVVSLQCDLDERVRETSELRVALNRARGEAADRTSECEHALRRCENAESEARRLRARIDELKGQLIEAQDAVDESQCKTRRLQRQLDENVEIQDALNVELRHSKSRLKQLLCTVHESDSANEELED